MLALVIPDMLCGLQGVFAVDAKMFLRRSQPVSALMIVLFCILLFFRQPDEVGETGFFLRPSLERSLLTTWFMFEGRPCRDGTGWVAVVRTRRCFWISQDLFAPFVTYQLSLTLAGGCVIYVS